MEIVEIKINGMSCIYCANAVEEELIAIEGVESVNVNLGDKKALVSLSKDIELDILYKAVEEAGYEVEKP